MNALMYGLGIDHLAPLISRVRSQGADSVEATSPLTGDSMPPVPRSTPDDVAAAMDSARAAQRGWGATPVRERAAVLLRLHDIVLNEQTDILDLIQLESGKARRSAFEEIADVAQVARHYGIRGPKYLRTRAVRGMVPGITSARVVAKPVGVVGVISPWNYPLTLALADVLPALVAGNAVVLKPDEHTSLSALWALDALVRAGLPEGVVEVVVGGASVGEALVAGVDHVVFTGSTATGRTIAAQAGERLIGATLELGGKNPMYVAADANIAAAVRGALNACFANAGQLCMSIERLVLHRDIAADFLAAFVPAVKGLKVGAGLDYSADVGSLTTSGQLERVIAHVDDAIARGARVMAGGVQRTDIGPFFYAPTILADLPADALCAREETFGPVVSVTEVASDDEAVAVMNDTVYGLNASIWTSRPERAARVLAGRVQAGTVNINDGYMGGWAAVAAPMGGFKDSGLGRRHGYEIIDAVTQPQTIAIQRGAAWGVSLDTLFELPDGKGQTLLTGALKVLRTVRQA